jgi:hypothetical protein
VCVSANNSVRVFGVWLQAAALWRVCQRPASMLLHYLD